MMKGIIIIISGPHVRGSFIHDVEANTTLPWRVHFRRVLAYTPSLTTGGIVSVNFLTKSTEYDTFNTSFVRRFAVLCTQSMHCISELCTK